MVGVYSPRISVASFNFPNRVASKHERTGCVCDPTSQTCFSRDCSEGDCPPNNLENYRQFTIRARDFSRCSDNSCLKECLNKTNSKVSFYTYYYPFLIGPADNGY